MCDTCPFKVGDWIVYKPSFRGRNLQEGDFLLPGQKYKVERIDKGLYVVVTGENHPGGGLYWTEFEPAQQGESLEITDEANKTEE